MIKENFRLYPILFACISLDIWAAQTSTSKQIWSKIQNWGANLGFCTYHQFFSYREYYCEGDSTCNCKKTKECLILRLETYAGISFKLKWFLKHLLFRSYCSFLETWKLPYKSKKKYKV